MITLSSALSSVFAVDVLVCSRCAGSRRRGRGDRAPHGVMAPAGAGLPLSRRRAPPSLTPQLAVFARRHPGAGTRSACGPTGVPPTAIGPVVSHKTLRITPAMAAGVCDHVWSLEEVAALAA